MTSLEQEGGMDGVAIVGMAARFPGARDLSEFWRNLVNGVESISHFTDEELEPSRLEQADVRRQPNYVKARGIIEDVDKFDAAFFSVTPRDAAIMDPQHRLLLETAWSALENAGYDPATTSRSIGVWAGMNTNAYLWENLLPSAGVIQQGGIFPVVLLNDKDYLATRISYKLDLHGPSVNVQTACSTGLVAVTEAYNALLSYQCDMALAGTASVNVPQKRGYLYQEGAIGSRDGRCRPFDAEASGTVFSDGVGAIVMKRLAEAIEDGDTIYAVIRGAAFNNDGARKAGFTAPSVDGQVEAIVAAQTLAGVSPDSISYVETHGTATPLGDPIEIAALTEAFRSGTSRTGFCAIGSVKSNIGHLDAAAGMAGIIKAALALHHKTIPASLHYVRPNPQIDFDDSPFFVNATLRQWEDVPLPRRAGVSSFGIGGTNSHVVLEEAPDVASHRASRPEHLVVTSARSHETLGKVNANLAEHLSANPDLDLGDVAFTLQTGRRAFPCRHAVVAGIAAEAAEELAKPIAATVSPAVADKVAFMFPGQGAQRVGMCAGLYESEPVFRTEFDACAEALLPHLGLDLRSLIFASAGGDAEAERQLMQTAVAQPALFAVEYALAQLWMHWGIVPGAMIGHSLGEYTAASLAGVFSRNDACALVAQRGRIMQQQPTGTMMAVRLSAEGVKDQLRDGVEIAGANAPEITVISGSDGAVKAMQAELEGQGRRCTILATSHAFHSHMMDGAIAPFLDAMRQVRLSAPQIPWISCLTGDWITEADATNPEYWARQLRNPVRFSDGVRRLLADSRQVLLEVGPGRALTTLALQHRDANAAGRTIASLDSEGRGDRAALLVAAGKVWAQGLDLDFAAVRGAERGRRVPLPSYPFERTRYWIDAPADADPAARGDGARAPREVVQEATGRDPATQPDVGDRTPSGQRLRMLLSSVSGIPESQIEDSSTFLELGFDSMLLTQVATAVNRAFGVDLSLKQLLGELRTPAAVAMHVAPAVSPVPPASNPTVIEFPQPASSIQPGIEPIYLGRTKEVFGTFHPAAANAGQVLTVICPPLFSEYMRVHLGLRNLAVSLARMGHDVLRFDYRGTGDSLGDLADISVADWISDVTDAIEEGRRRSGAEVVRVIGVRAGALLASHAAQNSRAADRYVFWDPVTSGTDYLNALRRVQRSILSETPLHRADRLAAADEHAGYRLSQRMLADLSALPSSAYDAIPREKLFVVSTPSSRSIAIAGAVHLRGQVRCEWEEIGGWENQLNARPVMEHLVACVTKP